MLKKILVATDGSDHARKAIKYASDLASKCHATVYLIHVVSEAEINEDLLRYVQVEWKIEEAPESVFLKKGVTP